ncbi:hypothetical protein AALO_G00091040 [Alosa alosa]|uniref:Uncharacterized protein n=1 Tax=Alosa alosa TaxID=278164 RepID=A0AAV6GV29_9TELE|nr:hypothetical protein AALO_G00091040 [Alosa alosa]
MVTRSCIDKFNKMPVCFVPQCAHSSRNGCSFFRFSRKCKDQDSLAKTDQEHWNPPPWTDVHRIFQVTCSINSISSSFFLNIIHHPMSRTFHTIGELCGGS